MLLSPKELAEQYPYTWEYLCLNRLKLEAREHGKWKHKNWYAFGRSQNLSEMEQPKILTPSIANQSSFTYDAEDYYYFVGSGGGGGGGYGITVSHNSGLSAQYLLGLLNSKLLNVYIKENSTSFRGGYMAFNRQYIEALPIRRIDPNNRPDKAIHDRIASLVERMLTLHQQKNTAATVHERTLLERQITATDRQIDQLVYALYGLTDEEVALVEGECKIIKKQST